MTDTPTPPLDDLPFSPEKLTEAMDATHHSGWNVSLEQKAAILREVDLWVDELYRETKVDLRAISGARGRALWEFLPALYLAAIEAGYRLAADSEYVKTMQKWREDDAKGE